MKSSNSAIPVFLYVYEDIESKPERGLWGNKGQVVEVLDRQFRASLETRWPFWVPGRPRCHEYRLHMTRPMLRLTDMGGIGSLSAQGQAESSIVRLQPRFWPEEIDALFSYRKDQQDVVICINPDGEFVVDFIGNIYRSEQTFG